MATYTEAQLINFYQAQRARVEAFGISNLQVGTPRLYKQGRKLVEAQAAAKLAESRKGTLYTDEYVEFLCHSYIRNGGDRKAAQAEFFKAFPEATHSASSVWLKLSKIRTFDSTCPGDTELNTDNQVLEILQGIDPERFSA